MIFDFIDLENKLRRIRMKRDAQGSTAKRSSRGKREPKRIAETLVQVQARRVGVLGLVRSCGSSRDLDWHPVAWHSPKRWRAEA